MTFPLVLLAFAAVAYLAASYQKPLTTLSPATLAWDEFAAAKAEAAALKGDYT